MWLKVIRPSGVRCFGKARSGGDVFEVDPDVHNMKSEISLRTALKQVEEVAAPAKPVGKVAETQALPLGEPAAAATPDPPPPEPPAAEEPAEDAPRRRGRTYQTRDLRAED